MPSLYDNENDDKTYEREREKDTQIVLKGRVKNNLIIFHLRLILFKLVFIVNIPKEDQEEVAIYVKFRILDRNAQEL